MSNGTPDAGAGYIPEPEEAKMHADQQAALYVAQKSEFSFWQRITGSGFRNQVLILLRRIDMSTVSAQQALADLQAAVTAEQAADATAVAAIQALQAQVASLSAGQVLTPAIIEGLAQASQTATSALSAAIPAASSAPTPAPAPTS